MIILLICIQDTLSSRAALGLPAFRPSASREQRYLAYKLLIAVSCTCNFHFEQFPQFSRHKMNLAVNYLNCSVYSAHSPKITPSILLQLNL